MFVVFAIDGKKIDMMMPIAKKKTYTTHTSNRSLWNNIDFPSFLLSKDGKNNEGGSR